MRKQVVLYGLGLALLVVLLKYIEYNFFIKSFSQEVYVGIIAVFFTGLGIWTGLSWMKRKQQSSSTMQTSEEVQLAFDISNREIDVLIGIAEGLSNQQIADKLFLSESTIKTHSSNLFVKLNVKRRTQAIQIARELGLLDH